MHSQSAILTIFLFCNSVRSYPSIWGTPTTQLSPVHGLYVKPSTDGVTGDLYVAATEDSGVMQWVVEQPVNYLPVATTASQAVPVVYQGYQAPQDDNLQKRAVITQPSSVPSQPVQYAYALPVPSANQETPVASYPYAYPIPATPTESTTPKCESSQTPQYPYQFPFQYFYPQMMNAYTNAMSILKETGMSDDTASAVMAHHGAPTMWPPSSYPPYAYPMYVMAVDPNTWAQNQASTTSATPTTAASPPADENSQV